MQAAPAEAREQAPQESRLRSTAPSCSAGRLARAHHRTYSAELPVHARGLGAQVCRRSYRLPGPHQPPLPSSHRKVRLVLRVLLKAARLQLPMRSGATVTHKLANSSRDTPVALIIDSRAGQPAAFATSCLPVLLRSWPAAPLRAVFTRPYSCYFPQPPQLCQSRRGNWRLWRRPGLS